MNKNKKIYKQEGSSLIMALLLGAMLLTVGILGMKMIVKQVEFSSNLLLSTRAYYAAESGVEKALYALKEFPVRHLKDANLDIALSENHHTTASISLNNKVVSQDFIFSEKETLKMRLAVQKAAVSETDITVMPNAKLTAMGPDWNIINNFEIEHVPDTNITDEIAKYQWKILCTIDGTTTEAIVGEQISINKLQSTGAINSFMTSKTFKNCFLSISSLDFAATGSPSKKLHLKITETNGGKLAPPSVEVTVIGKAQQKQKIIRFNYKQKNLGGLFDFTLFHKGG